MLVRDASGRSEREAERAWRGIAWTSLRGSGAETERANRPKRNPVCKILGSFQAHASRMSVIKDLRSGVRCKAGKSWHMKSSSFEPVYRVSQPTVNPSSRINDRTTYSRSMHQLR